MQLPSVDDVLKFFTLRGDQAIWLAVFCFVVLALSELGILYLDAIPRWLRAVFAVVGLGALAVWLVAATRWVQQRIETKRTRENEAADRLARQNALLAELDRISLPEKILLGWMLKRGTTTAPFDWKDDRAGSLAARGILIRSNEIHPRTDWPHTLPVFVWDALQTRKDEFVAAWDNFERRRKRGFRP